MFIDEIDTVGKRRDMGLTTNDEREQTLNQLLTEMDGFDNNKGIVVLGHERSEEPGMKFLGDWMSCFLPEIPVLFLDAEEPFGTFHCEIGE